MMADKDSRKVNYNEEYIPAKFFDKICRQMNIKPTIDMMATEDNRRVKKFVNRGPTNCCDAISFDVFAVHYEWVKDDCLYFFPPKNVVTQVLFLIATRFAKCKILLVFHLWEEFPKGFERIIRMDNVKIKYWRGAPLSIIPDDKVLLFDNKVLYSPQGQRLKRVIREYLIRENSEIRRVLERKTDGVLCGDDQQLKMGSCRYRKYNIIILDSRNNVSKYSGTQRSFSSSNK